MTTDAARPPLWTHLLLWLVLPPLALGYQITAEATAHALMSTPFGVVWFIKGSGLVSVRWLIGFEIASFVVWMIILDRMKLSQAFPGSAMSYVLVLALSALAYHEQIPSTALFGSCTILIGIWLVSHEHPT